MGLTWDQFYISLRRILLFSMRKHKPKFRLYWSFYKSYFRFKQVLNIIDKNCTYWFHLNYIFAAIYSSGFFLCFSSNKRRILKTKYTQTLHKNSFSTNGCCFSTIVFHDSTQKSMESFKKLLKSVVVVRSGDLYGRFDSLRSFLELDLICFSHSVQVT